MAKDKTENKVKLSPEQERFDRMQKLTELINKSAWGGKDKDVASVIGGEVVSNVTRFSTGNRAIDYAFGGGVPRGKIIELFGAESAGKSTLIYHIIANFQKTYPSEGILLLDSELSYDPLYAEALGVDAKGITYVEAETGTAALNIAKLAIESDLGIKLVLIDSIAALTTQTDDTGDIGKPAMAEQARMVSGALRVLTSLIGQHDVTLVITNQTRSKVGVIFGSPETTPAGAALKFYAHIRARLSVSGKIKKGEDVVGIEGKLDCVKNKVAPPFRRAEYSITWGIGIDSVLGTIDLAISKNIIVKKGGWFSFKNENIAQGRESLVELLRTNKELYNEIEEKLNEFLKSVVVGASKLSEDEIKEVKDENIEEAEII